METTQSLINGESVASAGTYDNIDPAAGRSLGPVGRSGEHELDQAVEAGAAAQPAWHRIPPEQRARILTRLADLVERDAAELARVESEDTGKPISQARPDATVCACYFRFYGHAIDSYYGQTIEAGVPAGVFNVVTGIGADRGVPTVLELGGQSAQIVFADADLEVAASFATTAILQNAGQTCSAGSRLLAHHSVHSELISRVADNFGKVSTGPGTQDPDLGPLVSTKQQDRVRAMVEAAHGEVVIGGAIPDDDALAGGSYFSPTLIDAVDPAPQIAQEEVFGPVLAGMTFDTEEEAVALANGTEYALIGAVWTRDISRAHRMAAAIQAGQVYVNTYGAGGGVELPFGGFKKSGYDREKGVEALDAYTQTKTVIKL